MPTTWNNTYLKFSGSSGIFHKYTILPAPLDSYSLSIWFRMAQTTQDIQRNMKLLTLKPNGFECFFNRLSELRCFSDPSLGSNDLVVNSDDIRLFNWYIVVIRSKSGQT